jgi:hypothetical protein
MKEPTKQLLPPDGAVGRLPVYGPFVILQQGDTTWVQPHVDPGCPPDPSEMSGGMGTGGPDSLETWCFEGGPLDTCGTNAPWDTKCFYHVDVRALPSQTGINFWHLDSLWTWQRAYCGSVALWCGSDGTWPDDLGNPQPVECGTWINPPGYGDDWNCVVQLELPDTFDVANGCTLWFDTRYDTECKYDYFYCEVYNGTTWMTTALFNACSNNYAATPCGDDKPAPDYWSNTDKNNLVKCNWQSRASGPDPNKPCFYRVITPDTLVVAAGFKVRWRGESDGAWSDKDGRGDTHGMAFIDNVWVYGDPGNAYVEDFEVNDWPTLEGRGWSKPLHEGVADMWHIVEDVDPPYEGDEVGFDRTTCLRNQTMQYRARPEQGYKKGEPWRNAWFYRLLTPSIPIQKTGAVVQYDKFMCAKDFTCDYTDTEVRFYDTDYTSWCPWHNIDGYILYGGCFFWNFNTNENVTPFYGDTCDSMQFCWEILDISAPGDYCEGKHTGTDNIIDNISVGFFDGNATIFTARGIDIFQDTFHRGICAYNSLFECNDADTVNFYWGGVPIQKEEQLYVEVTDKDGLTSVVLWGSDNEGGTWVGKTMTLEVPFDAARPWLGGEYYGTLCPSDFGDTAWTPGTEIWYYVLATDMLANPEYWRSQSDPNHEDHTGSRFDYFTFSILPMFPPGYIGTKILLVDGFGRWGSQWDPCLEEFDTVTGWEHDLEDIYEQALVDAGYCYDKYDISGAGSNVHCHPTKYGDYDCVIWFTGPYFSNYLFDKEAQEAIRDYLGVGGKVILAGDRIAYNMAVVGEDSLGGDFLAGIMGCNYYEEVKSPFYDDGGDPYSEPGPYQYMVAKDTVFVFDTPVEVGLDTLVIYRECPGRLRDMSYVVCNYRDDGTYLSQPVLDCLYEPGTADPAHGATYVEYQDLGQAVYINHCLSSMVNHEKRYCVGDAPDPQTRDYAAGTYEGRKDLLLEILQVLFALPPTFPGGGGGTSDVPKTVFRWGLAQNRPNPCVADTEIRFEIARTGPVSIKVYNAMGQLVRTLVDERRDPGRYSIRWDGRNQAGERVSSGVFFYSMKAEKFSETKKMLVVR